MKVEYIYACLLLIHGHGPSGPTCDPHAGRPRVSHISIPKKRIKHPHQQQRSGRAAQHSLLPAPVRHPVYGTLLGILLGILFGILFGDPVRHPHPRARAEPATPSTPIPKPLQPEPLPVAHARAALHWAPPPAHPQGRWARSPHRGETMRPFPNPQQTSWV